MVKGLLIVNPRRIPSKNLLDFGLSSRCGFLLGDLVSIIGDRGGWMISGPGPKAN